MRSRFGHPLAEVDSSSVPKSQPDKRMHQTWRGHALASGRQLVHFGREFTVLRRATQVRVR